MKIVLATKVFFQFHHLRLQFIKRLIAEGHEVHLVAVFDGNEKKMADLGAKCYHVDIVGAKINPFLDLKLVGQYMGIYRKIKPDLILHYNVKPNVFGTFASFLTGNKSIAIMTGLGFVFMKESFVAKIGRTLYRMALGLSEESWVLNQDDKNLLVEKNITSADKIFILHGEGLDTSFFAPIQVEKPADAPIKFLFVSRVLWDKGVRELAEASMEVKKTYPNVEVHQLGTIGYDSPDAVPKSMVEQWQQEGSIIFNGRVSDVRQWVAECDCVILPSYREGMSRALMEAASMGKPIIASNVGGCKEVVEEGKNGFLAAKQSASSLAEAMKKFMALTPAERTALGTYSREKAQREFEESKIVDDIFNRLSKYLSNK